ncbi:MAG: class C beta-lactamase-related serine hydrolase, partial [Desulfobacteraceae bacterium]
MFANNLNGFYKCIQRWLIMKNRIMIVLIIIFLFISCQPIGKSVMPVSTPAQTKMDENERNLPVSTPIQEKIDENALTTLVQSIKTDKANQYIDSLLIVRNGLMVTEEYFNYYRRDSQHTIQSVTKSFTSALIGMAIEQGVIQNVDQKILSFFPDISSIDNMDSRKKAIKLKDLLTMRSGTDYFEGEPGGESPHNDLNRLMKGWDVFYLNRPMISNPGERFQYDSGGVVLMSSILKNQSGMHADAFAAEYLFP